jgi:hypothetical protein
MKDKDKSTVYMCMSCGNCKRKDNEDGYSFTFTCSCGDFVVDSSFASKIEFIGCRSWIPADDNYFEPYIITIDGKRKEIKIGHWGKTFIDLTSDEFNDIANGYEEDEIGHVIDSCKEALGEN